MKRMVIFALLVAASASAAPPPLDAKTKQLAFEIYKQLIEINTTNSIGNNITAAEAMAARLKAAGFPAAEGQVLTPANPRYDRGTSDDKAMASIWIAELPDSRAHGKDERVRIDSFYDSVQFLYVLVKRLSS